MKKNKRKTVRMVLAASALGAILLQPGGSDAALCVDVYVKKFGVVINRPDAACSPIGQPPDYIRKQLRNLSDQINRITGGGVILDIG